jgi:hypothetical protein
MALASKHGSVPEYALAPLRGYHGSKLTREPRICDIILPSVPLFLQRATFPSGPHYFPPHFLFEYEGVRIILLTNLPGSMCREG